MSAAMTTKFSGKYFRRLFATWTMFPASKHDNTGRERTSEREAAVAIPSLRTIGPG